MTDRYLTSYVDRHGVEQHRSTPDYHDALRTAIYSSQKNPGAHVTIGHVRDTGLPFPELVGQFVLCDGYTMSREGTLYCRRGRIA